MTDAISSAKNLLISEVDSLKSENEINVPRRRRDSIDKPGAKASNDFDDILRIFTTLDERELLDNIARFVSVSPDAMPSSQIAVGDFAIVLSKLCNLEEQYQQLKLNLGQTGASVFQGSQPLLQIGTCNHYPVGMLL